MTDERKVIRVVLEFDSEDMARRGRIGAYARLAKYNAADLTAPARKAFMSRFEREVDPEGVLPIEERQRRAEYAKKAYFAELARKSAISRRNGKSRGEAK